MNNMDIDRLDQQSARLREARLSRGLKTAKAAAERFGFNYTTYSQHERGHMGIGRAAVRYAKAFKVSEAWLLTGEGQPNSERFVPIVGYAGAGPDGSVLFATGDGNFDEAPAPVDASPTTEALEVRGDSMKGVANDGWLIYYDDKEAPAPHHMGELCVCWLEDDRVLVKYPRPGQQRGLFTLESVNAKPLFDVSVRAFALVTDIKTRMAAQRYIRRNPDVVIPEAKLG